MGSLETGCMAGDARQEQLFLFYGYSKFSHCFSGQPVKQLHSSLMDCTWAGNCYSFQLVLHISLAVCTAVRSLQLQVILGRNIIKCEARTGLRAGLCLKLAWTKAVCANKAHCFWLILMTFTLEWDYLHIADLQEEQSAAQSSCGICQAQFSYEWGLVGFYLMQESSI